MLDGAAQTGNGWYMNGSTNFVAGYVSSTETLRLTSTSLYTASTINVGIGTSSPVYQTQIYGTGQTTSDLTDAGNKGGSLLLNTPTVSAGDGGALLFGAGGTGAKPFAAIKGLLVDGGGNTTGALAFSTRNATADTALTERARFDSSGVFVQKGATTAAGIKPTAIANNESITTVNSTTYTINLGTSAKLFWIALGNGDGALVFTSYISSSITFLGITPNTVAATASPSSAQLGISKSANSHDIVIKTGSALSSTAAAWQMGVLSSQVA